MSDPRPTTAAELREQARQIRATAAKRVREIQEASEREARALEMAAGIVEAINSGLPRDGQSDTLDAMGTSQNAIAAPNPSRPGPKFKTKHPLPLRAKARGMSIEDVADELTKRFKRKIPRTTVRSWYASKASGDGRPIPQYVADYLAEPPWDIPASAWKNGIDDT